METQQKEVYVFWFETHNSLVKHFIPKDENQKEFYSWTIENSTTRILSVALQPWQVKGQPDDNYHIGMYDNFKYNIRYYDKKSKTTTKKEFDGDFLIKELYKNFKFIKKTLAVKADKELSL